MRLFVPHLCSRHFLLDERIFWPWNPRLLLFHWGHVNTCIFLIWVPNLCLQACLFSVLKFPTWPPPISPHPCLFLFLALSLFPSVSILLICSHGRWRLESPPPQLHRSEWRRHTWQTAECNPPKYLSNKEIRWGLLLWSTAGGLCREGGK